MTLLLAIVAWSLATNTRQALIALDQWAGTCIHGGMADETLSARAFREVLTQDDAGLWYVAHDLIDLLFRWQPDHCYQSWRAEIERRQLPDIYRIAVQ